MMEGDTQPRRALADSAATYVTSISGYIWPFTLAPAPPHLKEALHKHHRRTAAVENRLTLG